MTATTTKPKRKRKKKSTVQEIKLNRRMRRALFGQTAKGHGKGDTHMTREQVAAAYASKKII